MYWRRALIGSLSRFIPRISRCFMLIFVVSISRWSTGSPVHHPQGFEISEEEGHFTVSYMAKQLERTTGT